MNPLRLLLDTAAKSRPIQPLCCLWPRFTPAKAQHQRQTRSRRTWQAQPVLYIPPAAPGAIAEGQATYCPVALRHETHAASKPAPAPANFRILPPSHQMTPTNRLPSRGDEHLFNTTKALPHSLGTAYGAIFDRAIAAGPRIWLTSAPTYGRSLTS